MIFKKLWIVLLASIAALAATVLLWRPVERPAPVRLAPRAESDVGRFNLGVLPIYSQMDPRWAGDLLGGSGETLRRAGCTVSALAMALTFLGFETDPGRLNRLLKEARGYTERGWIKWSAIEELTKGKIRVQIPEQPTHEQISRALAGRKPVLAKVMLPVGIEHWVLISGRAGREYFVNDPLERSGKADLLSRYGSDILAVRIVERVE